MPSQTTSRRTPASPKPTAELDGQPESAYIDGHRRRSESTVRPRRASSPAAPPARPSFAGRPRGHVVGHAIGEPPPPSSDGCPRGHVVGHRIGDPPPPSFEGCPRGHVVGHPVSPLPSRR